MASPTDIPPHQSLLKIIFLPHKVSVSDISASFAPRFSQPVPSYTEKEVLEAYLHPALEERKDVIWLPRDCASVSTREVTELLESLGTYGIEVTGEEAIMNEKGEVEWDDINVRQAPIWKQKVLY